MLYRKEAGCLGSMDGNCAGNQREFIHISSKSLKVAQNKHF
jgi:hypothetical protein